MAELLQLLHITERSDWEEAQRAGTYLVDQATLTAEVRFEDGGDGERYPHIYGPLPLASVADVIPVGRDAAGRLILPQDR
jgi:uncharacterized protein (DUF952 family)